MIIHLKYQLQILNTNTMKTKDFLVNVAINLFVDYYRVWGKHTTCGSPMRVLPVPGGPNSSSPLGGPRSPVKMSLKQAGNLGQLESKVCHGKFKIVIC